MIILDGVKRVVGSLGHEAADRMLAAVAQRLRAPLPADATLARTTGDTFTLVLEFERQTSSSRIAQRLQRTLRDGVEVAGVGRLGTGCCIGIALYPADADSTADLLRDAESALHRAKSAGPGSIAHYRPEMTAAATRRMALEQALRDALARDELELHYQPKLDLESTAIVGAEALIRWRRPDGELVVPGDFMGVVETSDLVHEVGRWVLAEAARTLRRWRDAGLVPVRVSVNVSGAMISVGGLAGVVAAAAAAAGIEPSLLEIEVLENILIEDPVQAEAELRAVRAPGVHIALDDFGTGYASLGYLKRFPFDVLKIDRGFIRGLLPNSESWTPSTAPPSSACCCSRPTMTNWPACCAPATNSRACSGVPVRRPPTPCTERIAVGLIRPGGCRSLGSRRLGQYLDSLDNHDNDGAEHAYLRGQDHRLGGAWPRAGPGHPCRYPPTPAQDPRRAAAG